MLKKIFILLSFIILSGCSATVQEKIKYVDRYIVTDVPKTYVTKTQPTPPIDMKLYMSMTEKERERAMSALAISLYGDVASCNADKDSIVKILEDQRKRYGQ